VVPPITPTYIKKIDVTGVISSSQARHDLLFGEVAIYTDPGAASANLATLAQLTTTAVGSAQTEDKVRLSHAFAANHSTVTAMYWDTIVHELKTGCRCQQWLVEFDSNPVDDFSKITAYQMKQECVCEKWLSQSSDAAWRDEQAKADGFPSRIPPMLQGMSGPPGSRSHCADGQLCET
jgi:hypothetical protein